MSASIPPSSYTSPEANRPPTGPRRHSQESTRSTRRKPVSYINVEEVASASTTDVTDVTGGETAGGGSPSTQSEEVVVRNSVGAGMTELVQPPIYILHPDRPLEDLETNETSPDSPPSYTYPPSSPTSTNTTTSSTQTHPHAQLPAYHPSPRSTSPPTLPRTLFLWGFICPLLWIVGVVMLCVPLKVYEDDFELAFESAEAGSRVGRGDEEWEKMKQRERMLLDEKVVILRRVSLGYSFSFLLISPGCTIAFEY